MGDSSVWLFSTLLPVNRSRCCLRFLESLAKQVKWVYRFLNGLRVYKITSSIVLRNNYETRQAPGGIALRKAHCLTDVCSYCQHCTARFVGGIWIWDPEESYRKMALCYSNNWAFPKKASRDGFGFLKLSQCIKRCFCAKLWLLPTLKVITTRWRLPLVIKVLFRIDIQVVLCFSQRFPIGTLEFCWYCGALYSRWDSPRTWFEIHINFG